MERVEQDPRLLRRAGSELDERVRSARGDDVGGVRDQDRALGAGRVVLGETGDLVEELGPAVVVEPLGREVLGRRGEAAARVGPQRRRRGPWDPGACRPAGWRRRVIGAGPSSGVMPTWSASATSRLASGTRRQPPSTVERLGGHGRGPGAGVHVERVLPGGGDDLLGRHEQEVHVDLGAGRDHVVDRGQRIGRARPRRDALAGEGEQHLGVRVALERCPRCERAADAALARRVEGVAVERERERPDARRREERGVVHRVQGGRRRRLADRGEHGHRLVVTVTRTACPPT